MLLGPETPLAEMTPASSAAVPINFLGPVASGRKGLGVRSCFHVRPFYGLSQNPFETLAAVHVSPRAWLCSDISECRFQIPDENVRLPGRERRTLLQLLTHILFDNYINIGYLSVATRKFLEEFGSGEAT